MILKPGDSIRVQQRGTWKPVVLFGRRDIRRTTRQDHILWKQMTIITDKTGRIFWRHKNPTTWRFVQWSSSEDTNSRDPVAGHQLPNDPRNESDSELTSPTSPILGRVSGLVIRVPLHYRKWFIVLNDIENWTFYWQTEDTFLMFGYFFVTGLAVSLCYICYSVQGYRERCNVMYSLGTLWSSGGRRGSHALHLVIEFSLYLMTTCKVYGGEIALS